MTNQDLKQISDLLEQKLDEKLEPIKQDINMLKKGQEKLEKGQERLEARQEKLEIRQERLETRQEKLEKGQEKLILSFLDLKDEVDGLKEENQKTRRQIITSEEKIMSSIDNIDRFQILNIGEHDKIKDNHEKLEIKVGVHEIRIKALEPVLV